MKILRGLCLAALAGCAGPRSIPEGQIPDVGRGNARAETLGSLIVRTQDVGPNGRFDEKRAFEGGAPFNVLDADGEVVQTEVQGRTTLKPGRYLVEVPRATAHARWFWVTVAAGETTEVDARKIPAEAR